MLYTILELIVRVFVGFPLQAVAYMQARPIQSVSVMLLVLVIGTVLSTIKKG